MEHELKTEIDPIELFLNSYKVTPFEPLEKDSLHPEKRTRVIKYWKNLIIYIITQMKFFLSTNIYGLYFKKFYDKDINTIPDYNIYKKHNI